MVTRKNEWWQVFGCCFVSSNKEEAAQHLGHESVGRRVRGLQTSLDRLSEVQPGVLLGYVYRQEKILSAYLTERELRCAM